MKIYMTVVYCFDDNKAVADKINELKKGFADGSISAMGQGDEMTKLDQLREIAEEHGSSGFDEMVEILNA